MTDNWQSVINLHELSQLNLQMTIYYLDEAIKFLHETIQSLDEAYKVKQEFPKLEQ